MEGLFRAIRRGNEARVAKLLNADPALLEGSDFVGDIALTVAAKGGNVGMVRLLIERGANSNATGYVGMTALHCAVEEGHKEVVSLLLNNGAQANAKDENGRTPCMLASMEGHVGMVRLLLPHLGAQGLEERDRRWDESTALHYAAGHGQDEVVALLLASGAEANVMNKQRNTPFMLACMNGHIDVVRLLVNHTGGQRMEEKNSEGMTALHMAALLGHEGLVTYLLSEGAQATSRDEDESTPLLRACGRGHMGVVRVLLQHTGPQAVQETDEEGKTALHYAAEGARLEVVTFLLFAGADPTIVDEDGRTPIELCYEEKGHEDISEDYARCRDMFEWWEGEPERRGILCKAIYLHKAYTMHQHMPTSQVPTYLEARVTAGHALPSVEVVSPPSQGGAKKGQAGAKGKRKSAGRKGTSYTSEQSRRAMLEYVVKTLNEQLQIELLEGFCCDE